MEYKKQILTGSTDANQYSAVSTKKRSEYTQKPTHWLHLPSSFRCGLRHTQKSAEVSKYYHLSVLPATSSPTGVISSKVKLVSFTGSKQTC